MSLRRRKPTPPPPPAPTGRLAGIRPHIHDEDDDRQSGDDRAPALSRAFSPPVPLPRFLQTRRERERGGPVS
jgi:hypothetical protein